MPLATRGPENPWIDYARLDSDWERCLAQFTGGPPDARRAMLRPFACLRDEFIETMRTIPDSSERDSACAAFFILLKSYWILLTTRSGYRISAGQSNNRLLCRAGLFAALIAQVEKNLPADQADKISAVMSRPLDVRNTYRRASARGTDGTAFDGAETPQALREEELLALIHDQQAELEGLREGKALLEQVFGTDKATEICAIFGQTRASVSLLMEEIEEWQAAPGPAGAETGGDATQLRNQLATLQERVAALEQERAAYRTRDKRFRAEIGTDAVDAIAARFHEAKAGGLSFQNELNRMLETVEQSLNFAA